MTKQWAVFEMEFKWRLYRFLRKLTHYMVKKRHQLSSRSLCVLTRIMDNNYADLIKLKYDYEKKTGETIVFYRQNII